MPLLPLPPSRLRVALRAVAVVGIVSALFGMVAGWVLLGRTSEALSGSLELTEDSLEALDASAQIAEQALEGAATSLATLDETSQDLDVTFSDAQDLLEGLADIVRDDVAGSVSAIEESLPDLAATTATIDSTLQTLSTLPFGPDYDPEAPLEQSVVQLESSLQDLPERLVEQAGVIEETAANLDRVGGGIGDLAAELATFDATLAETGELLGTYELRIEEGQQLVGDAVEGLSTQVWMARIAVVALGLSFLGLQLVPLQWAAMLDSSRDPATASG